MVTLKPNKNDDLYKYIFECKLENGETVEISIKEQWKLVELPDFAFFVKYQPGNNIKSIIAQNGVENEGTLRRDIKSVSFKGREKINDQMEKSKKSLLSWFTGKDYIETVGLREESLTKKGVTNQLNTGIKIN